MANDRSGSISSSMELVDVTECAVCGSSSNMFFESIVETERTLTYCLCSNCGTVYQSPRMTKSALKTYYEAEYVEQHQHATGVTEKELRIQAGRARNLVQILMPRLTRVKRHLDIGSSTGSLMLVIMAAYRNQSIGIEPADVYRAYCEARGLTVVPELESLSESIFDLITMAHVMEHLPDPVGYLRTIREHRLEPDGTLLVEVPNLFGHPSLETPHLFCFSAETLRYTLEMAGYEVIQMERHGSPRSKLIPLYLTAIARPAGDPEMRKSNPRTVPLKRRLGMIRNRFVARIAPGLAWLPLPEMGDELE